MSTKLFIRKNDLVAVVAGKDKGKQGKVLKVDAKAMKLQIEGVNIAKRHVKPSQKNPQGGVVEKSLPIHYSNVMIVHPKTKKPTRATKFTRGKKGELIEKTESKK